MGGASKHVIPVYLEGAKQTTDFDGTAEVAWNGLTSSFEVEAAADEATAGTVRLGKATHYGTILFVKNLSNKSVIVRPTVAINANILKTLNSANETVTVMWNGTDWKVLSDTENNFAGSNAKSLTAAATSTVQVDSNSTFVTVTSDSADKIIVLPEPTVGREINIFVESTGFELRTSDPLTININGGTVAALAESAVSANTLVKCICVSSTKWIATAFAADGTVSALEASAA